MKRIIGIAILFTGFIAVNVSNANAIACAEDDWRAACVGRNGGFAVGPHGYAYAYDYRGQYGYHTWGQRPLGHRFYRR
jgi:hypothetical protein